MLTVGVGVGVGFGDLLAAGGPPVVTGLQFWIDPRDYVGTPDGTILNTITNKANAATPLNTTRTAFPTFVANSVGGKPGFSVAGGVRDIRQSAGDNYTASASYTQFIVLRATGGASTNQIIAGLDRSDAGFHGRTALLRNGQAGTPNTLLLVRCTGNVDGSPLNNSASQNWLQSATYQIVRAEVNGIARLFKNGVQVGSDGTTNMPCADAGMIFCLATDAINTGSNWPGHVAETLIYCPALSASDAAATEAYLAAGWQ